MTKDSEELMKDIEDLGPLVAKRKHEYLKFLEIAKDSDDYLEFLRRAKDSEELRRDIEDIGLVLAKRKHDYIEFLKTKTGKKCEAFKQRLNVCLEEYRNAKTEAEEAEVEKRRDAVYAEIEALPEKEREVIGEKLRGYGSFARIAIHKHGLKWHLSALKTLSLVYSVGVHAAAPNKRFGKPLFDENILKERAEGIARQAFDMSQSYLNSKYPNLTAKFTENKEVNQRVKTLFASKSEEAIEELIRPYGERAPSYVRNDAVDVFIVKSCPAMHDEETNRIIFNLGEIGRGRTQTEAEFYLLQTAIHEYLHLFGGLELKGKDLEWMAEGIVERISYDICESKGRKLNWIESGYAPYLETLKWLNDLGIENKTQDLAYFSRNPQLLIDEMRRIGVTPSEIENIMEYGSRINIRDDLQTDLFVYMEYLKTIKRRLEKGSDGEATLTERAKQAGLVFEKKDVSAIGKEKDLDQFLQDTFRGCDKGTSDNIKRAATYSKMLWGGATPTAREIAEFIQDKLASYGYEFHVMPSADVSLENFIIKEIINVNNLRFGGSGGKEEKFEFNKAAEIFAKLGMRGDAATFNKLAEKAVGYLWWKNVHEPTAAQVADVILQILESVGKRSDIHGVMEAIDAETVKLVEKTKDDMYKAYKQKSANKNLVRYFANVGYKNDQNTVDACLGIVRLAETLVFPSDFVHIHPELGIVRADNEGNILSQYSHNFVGGSYHLKMYTINMFEKMRPMVGERHETI